MNKPTDNQSPNAAQLLVERAVALGLAASVISRSAAHYRRDHPSGSTSVPQKVVNIDGKRFSVGGAKQYLIAKEAKNEG